MDQAAVILAVRKGKSVSAGYLEGLIREGFCHVILVGDVEKSSVPQGVYALPCPGFGSGEMLKAGLQYYQDQLADRCCGVIIAEAAYDPTELQRLAAGLEHAELVLGIRENPGSRMLARVFSLLYSKSIPDVLTDLRAVANRRIPGLLQLRETGPEFGTRMLVEASRQHWSMAQCNVAAEPAEAPAGSDLRSAYMVLLRCFCLFMVSSLVSSGLDVGLFALCTKVIFVRMDMVRATFWANAIARILSSLENYYANKKLVFRNEGSTTVTLFRFTVLCIVQALGSWLMIVGMNYLTHWDTTILKIIADCILFLLSYQVQQQWVFQQT